MGPNRVLLTHINLLMPGFSMDKLEKHHLYPSALSDADVRAS